MPKNKTTYVCVLVAVVVLLGIWVLYRKEKEGMDFVGYPKPGPDPNPSYKSGFLPSKQGPYFQNLPPSLNMERQYHDYIKQDCEGNYGNYECRQKAYIKTLKGGTTDKTDLMCWAYKDNEDAYYACLDGIYGNRIWMDRFTGASPCHCADGSQGASSADGTCFCPPPRDLHDRRPLDQNYEPVNRVIW